MEESQQLFHVKQSASGAVLVNKYAQEDRATKGSELNLDFESITIHHDAVDRPRWTNAVRRQRWLQSLI